MNIRVNLATPISDGTEVVFRSPVDCSQVTGLVVYYDGGSKEFAFADAHGNNVGDIDHLFAENVVVKVILDVTNAMAFVQNADTNAYIEGTFVKTVNGAKPDENGNVVVEIPEGGGSGEAGADGFSPIANVTQTASGAVISITDKSGTTTATIANGKDGAKGDKGDTGATGAQGIQGEKGEKGDTGAAGANGKDGVSATHSWNGTTLTITSASGTSSANLKGDKGDQGIQGEQGPKGDTGSTGSQGPKGDKGDTGATGATGSKGDKGDKGDPGDAYVLTAGDKAELVAMVIESLGGNPIFGTVDSNNNIVVSGNLPDGTYSVKYEMENGTKVNIGNLVLDTNVYYTVTNTLTQCTTNNSTTKVVQGGSYSATITAKSGYELSSVNVTMGGSNISSTAVSGGKIAISNVTGNIVITAVAEEIVVTPSYKNWLPLSVDANGNDFVGTHANGGDGYEYGYRISGSSGSQSAQAGVYCSGFIPISGINDVVRIANITLIADSSRNNVVFYDANKNYVIGKGGGAGSFDPFVKVENGIYSFRASSLTASAVSFFRFSCGGITDETVVTINEEITD